MLHEKLGHMASYPSKDSVEYACIVAVLVMFGAFFGLHSYAKAKTLAGEVKYVSYIVMPLFWWTYLVGALSRWACSDL